jgi:hypothetical protein
LFHEIDSSLTPSSEVDDSRTANDGQAAAVGHIVVGSSSSSTGRKFSIRLERVEYSHYILSSHSGITTGTSTPSTPSKDDSSEDAHAVFLRPARSFNQCCQMLYFKTKNPTLGKF